MAVIKGYFDDSQTAGRYWVVGGYVGDSRQWENFESLWPLVLAKHGVPYFHMSEMADPNGVFAKWHPPQYHQVEITNFSADLTKAIRDCNLTAFGSLVRVQDLERFNSEFGLKLEPYPLAAYTCMLLVARDYPGTSAELIFDHIEKVDSKLVSARRYADSDKYHVGVFGRVVTTPLPECLTCKEIPGLQAADFFSWEYRKSHLSGVELFDTENKNKSGDLDARWEHFNEWSLQKFGSRTPTTRKSAAALVGESGFDGLLWDYDALVTAHDLRGRIWT